MRDSPRVLYVVDDGWRPEKQRAIQALLDAGADVRLATHVPASQAALQALFGEVQLLEIQDPPAWRHYPAMFFARELDTVIVQNLNRERARRATVPRRMLNGVRAACARLGMRRHRYSTVRRRLYRGSRQHAALLADTDVLLFVPVAIRDQRILHEADERGVAVLAWVYSWDNPMKDNDFFLYARSYGVWNAENRKDLETLHGIPPEKVAVIGPNQFDVLISQTAGLRRELREPPTVLYICCTGRDHLVVQEEDFILWIREVMDQVCPAARLLVRPYPFRDLLAGYARLEAAPGIEVAHFGEEKDGILQIDAEEDARRLAQMAAAACMINLGSTMGLEGAFTGTPMLQFTDVPEFPRVAGRPYLYPLRHALKNEHLRYMLTGDFPSFVRDTDSLSRGLRDILLEGKETDYLEYSRHLRRFADPMPGKGPYMECFVDWVISAGQGRENRE